MLSDVSVLVFVCHSRFQVPRLFLFFCFFVFFLFFFFLFLPCCVSFCTSDLSLHNVILKSSTLQCGEALACSIGGIFLSFNDSISLISFQNVADPCDASTLITPGADNVGDCTSTLASGSTCTQTASEGFTCTVSSCLEGVLTAGTCSGASLLSCVFDCSVV